MLQRTAADNPGQLRTPRPVGSPARTPLTSTRPGTIPSMACKGSGVQIPSAPPQVNGPIRPRPYPDRPPEAADRQQSPSRRPIRRPPERHIAVLAGVVWWSDPLVRSPRASEEQVRWDSKLPPRWSGDRGQEREGAATCDSVVPVVTARACQIRQIPDGAHPTNRANRAVSLDVPEAVARAECLSPPTF
jgi:hypothetical protein